MKSSTRIWPAVVLTPLLALADQSTAYALVQWSCATQEAWVGHGVHLVFLLATIGLGFAAWVEWRGAVVVGREDAAFANRNFLALVGVLSAAFSALVIVALWLPQWVLSPCYG